MKTKIEIPKVIDDNDIHYITLLVSAIEYSSPDSKGQILRSSEGYSISIESEEKSFRQEVINNLLALHKKLHIPIKFSSSLAISNLIQFTIPKKL